MNKNQIKSLLIIIAVTGAFILMSYLSSTYAEYLQSFIKKFPILGVLIYLFGLIVATVMGPVTLLPALPLAVTLWGPFLTAVLTSIGWTIGAIIAFNISKKYGRNVVNKFISDKQLRWIEGRIPSHNLFIAVIIFRIAVPVDFVSYALGLFTDMKLRSYTIATFVGTLPLCLALSYSVELPNNIKIWVAVAGVVLLFLGYLRVKKPQ